MSRNLDSAEFHAVVSSDLYIERNKLVILQVYGLVRSIPICRVTTYGKHFEALSVRSYNIYSGHIAKLAGMPNHSRHVGQGKKLKFWFYHGVWL